MSDHSGRTRVARIQKTLGRFFSADHRLRNRTVSTMTPIIADRHRRQGMTPLALVNKVGSELAKLFNEVLVAARDDPEIGYLRLPTRCECGDEVAKAASKIGNFNVCSGER